MVKKVTGAPPPAGKCSECGGDMSPRMYRQKFCSDACRQRAFWKRHKEKTGKNYRTDRERKGA